MNTKTCTIGLLALASCAGLASATVGNVLLEIDLSVANQVTITATNGLADASISGADVTGVYFDNFYGGAGDSLSATYQSGDISTFGDDSDGSPSLFRAGSGSDSGLNMWSWATASTVDFTAGEQAFQGSAVWALDANEYADMLAGNTFGDLYFPADDFSDIAGATVVGQWAVIPAPSALAVLGLGGLVAARRRR